MKKFSLAVCIALSLSVTGFAGEHEAAAPAMTGNADAGKTKAAPCQACHGADGNSIAGTFPSIAGQHPKFMTTQLAAFKGGVRQDPLMAPQAMALSEQDMLDLAAYFSVQTIKTGKADPAQAVAGAKLYQGGNAAAGVPACMACHSPNGTGNPYMNYPSLRGQWPEYTVKQLNAYKTGARNVDANSKIMTEIAMKLSDAEMAAVAQYISGLY